MFKANDNKIISSNSDIANKTVRNFSRNLIHISNNGAISKPTFFTLDAKKTFNHL